MSINQKLLNVMRKVERIPKNGYNDFHKYHYVTEADASEHIRKAFIEEGIAFYCTCEEQERNGEYTKVRMRFTLVDIESGEKLESVIWGEGQDKGDKGLYKAYTGAVKYFLMKTFLIPTGDDPEADEGKAPLRPHMEPMPVKQASVANAPKTNASAQMRKLFAMAKAAGLDKSGLKAWLKEVLKREVQSMNDIKPNEWQILFQKLGQAQEELQGEAR